MAEALVRAGAHNRAERIARPLMHPRALVLVDVARKLEPAQARPLLARASREGDWRQGVGAPGREWPEAVAATADALVEAME